VSGESDYRRWFEESPDILLVLLPDAPRFTMVGATRARLAVTHTTLEQIVGRGLFEVFPDDPNDPEATGTRNLLASLERVLATRAADTMAVQKYDIQVANGEFVTRHWSPKNIPVLGKDGTIEYIFHRVEDVTELVRASEQHAALLAPARRLEREVVSRSRELASANEALRDVAAELKELDRVKTEFFSNVSHEFRTPLTLMLGPLEEVLTQPTGTLRPVDLQRIALAHSNALRLLKLVNSLLDFSRLQAGRTHARFAPVDLARATAELGGMFESAISRTDLRLVIDAPSLSEPLWLDREMWEKIVLNLVSNAFKFTHSGEIAVRVRDGAAAAILEVADTGIGIPASELAHVFDRFHRVAGVTGRTYEGTGIGLALVRELVELHGGRVSVTSTEGVGTTFTVEIPKGHAHLPAEAVVTDAGGAASDREARAHVGDVERWMRTGAEAVAPDGPRAAAGTRPRVLVVDDNADLRDYIATLLSPDYEVSVAVDGIEGLAAARSQRPDLIVSDVMMPGLNGVELVRELRTDPEHASIPVILVSARAGEEAAIEGLDAGSDDYLIKPFSSLELLARVRTHVQLARRRREWIEDLESANRELDAFTYSVAHDLRAPLVAVNGFTEMLLERNLGQLDAEGQRYLQQIAEAGLRMTQLIEDLLRLSKITRSELRRETFDLSALATEIADQLRRANAPRPVEVRIQPGMRADGDPRLVRIVLENLLGNAWKFTGRQPAARVEFGVDEGSGAPIYFVRDNGAGFDMKYAARLFGVFQRLHAQAEFAGTGIGLATVQRIVSRHRGRVWAEGAVNAGATIYFTLGATADERAAVGVGSIPGGERAPGRRQAHI
jgi:signal transduction histidine kinase